MSSPSWRVKRREEIKPHPMYREKMEYVSQGANVHTPFSLRKMHVSPGFIEENCREKAGTYVSLVLILHSGG